jgi:thiol-disulfide isomerase/thioredoxin
MIARVTVACAAFSLGACKTEPLDQRQHPLAPVEATQAAASSADRTIEFEEAPPGDVIEIVKQAKERESNRGRTLIVYVGAPWCEPCQAFHKAATQGRLETARSAKVTLLEFNLDEDRARLQAAGYHSKYIPLFIKPQSDGRPSDRRAEGGIKGTEAAAAAFVERKLASLLGP